jgi:hypothetical protein
MNRGSGWYFAQKMFNKLPPSTVIILTAEEKKTSGMISTAESRMSGSS